MIYFSLTTPPKATYLLHHHVITIIIIIIIINVFISNIIFNNYSFDYFHILFSMSGVLIIFPGIVL